MTVIEMPSLCRRQKRERRARALESVSQILLDGVVVGDASPSAAVGEHGLGGSATRGERAVQGRMLPVVSAGVEAGGEPHRRGPKPPTGYAGSARGIRYVRSSRHSVAAEPNQPRS